MYFSKRILINCGELRVQIKEGHTEITCVHDNACEIVLKTPTADCPSGAKSGQFEMHCCLPNKLQVYQ